VSTVNVREKLRRMLSDELSLCIYLRFSSTNETHFVSLVYNHFVSLVYNLIVILHSEVQ